MININTAGEIFLIKIIPNLLLVFTQALDLIICFDSLILYQKIQKDKYITAFIPQSLL